jgi:uncharacterized RDD family membrane protein YckC
MSNVNQTPGQPVDAVGNWFQRLIAYVIDSIPWIVIAYIISWVLFWNAPLANPIGGFYALTFAAQWWWLIWLFIWPLFYGIPLLIYCYVMENSVRQATFGKGLMGLQVQTTNGGKPNSGQVLKRNLSKILWIVFLIDILMGLATKGNDPRQRYFDRMAGTTVISTRDVFGAAAAPPPPPPPPA